MLAHTQYTLVQFQAPVDPGVSSRGKTAVFKTVNGGSSPPILGWLSHNKPADRLAKDLGAGLACVTNGLPEICPKHRLSADTQGTLDVPGMRAKAKTAALLYHTAHVGIAA